MQPTLNENLNDKRDRVFLVRPNLLKHTSSIYRGPESKSYMETFLKRGDVVSFVSPKDPNECFIKRVVGLPNDRIRRLNHVPRRLKLSEADLDNLDRIDSQDDQNEDDNDEYEDYITVPAGHIWIEGDNYKVSNDSNLFGSIPMGLVIGKALFSYYPLNRIKWIESKLPEHRVYQPISNDDECKNAVNYKIKFSRK